MPKQPETPPAPAAPNTQPVGMHLDAGDVDYVKFSQARGPSFTGSAVYPGEHPTHGADE